GGSRARRAAGARRGRRARLRGGGRPMIALSVALVIPWASGIVLVLCDGRRLAVVGIAAAPIAANLVALVVLAASVLSDGPVRLTTGDWPAGGGLALRADGLGAVVAGVSS